MKKWIAALLIVVSLFALAGCTKNQPPAQDSGQAESPAAAQKKVIGVSLYYKRDEYYMDMEAMLKKLADERGYELLIQDADADPAKQTSQIESFITSKVDLILFGPADPDGVIPAVKAANAAGIPLISFDASVNGGELASVVILDNFKAGEEMGLWAKDYIETNLDGKANIAVLDFPVATTSCVPRVEGFLSVVSQMPGVEVVAQQDGKASRTDSMAVMENILTANPDIDLVFGINDNTIFGAIAAAETKGKTDIVFCDVGWSDELFDRLSSNDPYIKASALSSPIEVAITLLDSADRYFAGKELDEIQYSATYVLTADNADDFKQEIAEIRGQ